LNTQEQGHSNIMIAGLDNFSPVSGDIVNILTIM